MSADGFLVEALRGHALFGRLSPGEVDLLTGRPGCREGSYSKGQIIHLQHETCYEMDVVLAGRVAIQRIDEGGKVLKIAVFAPGDVIGANLMFASRNHHPYMVIAESDATLAHIHRDTVLRLGQMNVNFLRDLLSIISDRALVLVDKIDTISLKTIRQRIMDVFRYEYHWQARNPILLSTTKKDLAERLGIARTSLSRELSKMRRDGLLEYDAKTVRLLRAIDLTQPPSGT